MKRASWLVVMLGFVAICVICNAKGIDDPEAQDPLHSLVQSLRSDFLKEACLEQHPALLGVKSVKAKKAVDLFYDLRAQEVLLDAFKSKNYMIREYAMKALRDLAQPGDKEIAKAVIEQMDLCVGTMRTGGSETHGAFDEFMKAMVETLAKITGLDTEGVSVKSDPSLRAFVAKAKQWLLDEEKKIKSGTKE